MHRLHSKLILSSFALLFSILMVEIGFALILPQPKNNTVHSLNRGRFTKPGIYQNNSAEFSVPVKVNQAGFVDREWKQGETDILLVGDSFVQAAQVKESDGLGRRMMHHFRKKNQRQTVISIGVPGAGTVTEFELIKEYAPQLKPKEILLGFLVGNDIFNNHWDLESKSNKPFYRVNQNNLELFWKENPIHSTLAWRYSHVFRWLYQKYWRYLESNRQLSQEDQIPLPLNVHNPNPSKTWTESWHITKDILREMRLYCQKNNILFTVLLFPVEVQINTEKERSIKYKWPMVQHWDFEHTATNRIQSLLNKEDIPYIDLSPYFRRSSQKLYFDIDGHWTKEGHELAAQTIVDTLTTR